MSDQRMSTVGNRDENSNHGPFHRSNRPRYRFGFGPRDVWIGMVIFASVIGVVLIQMQAQMPWEILLSIAFLFGLSVWRRQGWAILVVVCAFVLMRFVDSKPWNPMSNSVIEMSDLNLLILLMLFAGMCFRYLELAKYIQGFLGESEKASYDAIKPQPNFPAVLRGRWWLIPVAISLAVVSLEVIPFDEFSGKRLGIKPFAARPILIGFFLFFVWFGARSLFGLISSWKMKPDQAAIRARSLMAKEIWKEHSAIEFRRAKIRSRQTR
ncbi:MAG: hypothetical protein AB8B55_12910 [Mariniblastus sp.]